MNLIISNKGVSFFGKEFSTQRECAKYFGVSAPYISEVFTGKREPSAKMLAKCGYRKVVNRSVTYEKIGSDQ